MRVERPVADFNGLVGIGSQTLLSCPSAGLSIVLPSGGVVPPEALRRAGGPLDGVAAGVTWDAAFLLQWRLLCVQNDPTTGLRTAFVDGWPIGSTIGGWQPT